MHLLLILETFMNERLLIFNNVVNVHWYMLCHTDTTVRLLQQFTRTLATHRMHLNPGIQLGGISDQRRYIQLVSISYLVPNSFLFANRMQCN